MNDFDILKDKIVKSVKWDDTKLKFDLGDTIVCFRAQGDCCSSSFIEDLDNPEIFIDAKFLSVEAESGEQKDINEYEVHKWTFYKFVTDKGMCTLSFRNESNGYYDGWLELVKQ